MANLRDLMAGISMDYSRLHRCVGALAMLGCLWFLCRELAEVSPREIGSALRALPIRSWMATALAGLVAGILLFACDRLSRRQSIPAPLFRKLTTFWGGAVTIGVAVVLDPFSAEPLAHILSPDAFNDIGKVLLGLTALYLECALLPWPSFRIAGLSISYPKPITALVQVALASATMVTLAIMLFLALPPSSGSSLHETASIFFIAFSVGLLSGSPGGFVVFDLLVFEGMPTTPPADIVASLILFRLTHLVLMLSLIFYRRARQNHAWGLFAFDQTA